MMVPLNIPQQLWGACETALTHGEHDLTCAYVLTRRREECLPCSCWKDILRKAMKWCRETQEEEDAKL